MEITGHCYCGAIEYRASGEPLFRGQCHCRECQYTSGGSANVFLGMPADQFEYTKGTPKAFTRSDLPNPVTREFCSECGTPLLTRTPNMPGAAIIKVGSLDDPGLFGLPQMAIFTGEKQEFHSIPEGVAAFEKLPG